MGVHSSHRIPEVLLLNHKHECVRGFGGLHSRVTFSFSIPSKCPKQIITINLDEQEKKDWSGELAQGIVYGIDIGVQAFELMGGTRLIDNRCAYVDRFRTQCRFGPISVGRSSFLCKFR